MAAKKNKKGKTPQTQSLGPKNYILTKARQLPIHACFINQDWRTTGLAHIIVVRRMPSGKFLAGVYLVDIFCTGIKQSLYQFNMDDEAYHKMYNLMNDAASLETISYEQAHHIIHGAVAFAAKCGFEPDKDFKFTQYILAPADDIMADSSIVFGQNGIPHFVPSPGDSERSIRQTLAILDEVVGKGNYTTDFIEGPDSKAGFGYEIEHTPAGLAVRILIDQTDKAAFHIGDFSVSLTPQDPPEAQAAIAVLGEERFDEIEQQLQQQPEQGLAAMELLIAEYGSLPFFKFMKIDALIKLQRDAEALEIMRQLKPVLSDDLGYTTTFWRVLYFNNLIEEMEQDFGKGPDINKHLASLRPLQPREVALFYNFYIYYHRNRKETEIESFLTKLKDYATDEIFSILISDTQNLFNNESN